MTHPNLKGLSFVRTLVANLESLDPDTPVRLEAFPERARFSNASTGMILAEIELSDV